MEPSIIILIAFTLIGVIIFIFLYLTTEKKKRGERAAELNELKQLSANLQNQIQDTTNQVNEKFDVLAKDVRNAQDQANQKINSGFEKLQIENSNIQKDVSERIADIKTAFKEYSEKVKETLVKYSDDNAEFKKSSEQMKEQIHKELQNILKEIKTPLDLD